MEITELLPAHWEEVKRIYEQGIATGQATFETEAPSWQNWDSSHLPFCRLVALNGGNVCGWAALSPVSSRCVYAGVAEVSVYIGQAYRGQRIGEALLGHLISESEQHHLWTLQAGIFTENTASVKLHEKLGFRIVGRRERIGRLHGVWRDTYLLERRSPLIGNN
ncbi:N-acetyltransferase [Rufibacter immobilis]|uniref:N-acetyltransferase n=1 Tax=Rufibacter immobilis TaxID=1348778 RepID=A0A3M9MWS4_9BACT|nr:GNAT family N-acetyltransferase [Rufibacter immobilis]RNI29979.1 N-acetyltransferase [Rufibacter immobilis]